LLVLTAVTVYQVRAIMKARYPAIRAIEALAATAPLFLLLFEATYFLMAQADLSSFNVHALTRTDALPGLAGGDATNTAPAPATTSANRTLWQGHNDLRLEY